MYICIYIYIYIYIYKCVYKPPEALHGLDWGAAPRRGENRGAGLRKPDRSTALGVRGFPAEEHE